MGIFKGIGYPEDIGRFFRLEEYEGHCWIAHGRFPTNSVGWWEVPILLGCFLGQ